MDCSLPGSSMDGILQVRILECIAFSFSRKSSWPTERTCVSCIAQRCGLWWPLCLFLPVYLQEKVLNVKKFLLLSLAYSPCLSQFKEGEWEPAGSQGRAGCWRTGNRFQMLLSFWPEGDHIQGAQKLLLPSVLLQAQVHFLDKGGWSWAGQKLGSKEQGESPQSGDRASAGWVNLLHDLKWKSEWQRTEMEGKERLKTWDRGEKWVLWPLWL